MTDSEFALLQALATSRRGLLGPPPEYQGDFVYCSGPEMRDLVHRKMVGRRKLAHPRSSDGHLANPPYLQFTHRYRLLKRGRDALAISIAATPATPAQPRQP